MRYNTQKEVIQMKRFLVVAVALVCAMGVLAPANAAVLLDWDVYGIGTVVPAEPPGGDAVEVENLQYFINNFNGVSLNPLPYSHTYTPDYGSAVTALASLPTPATWGEKDDSPSSLLVDLSALSASYDYLLAKYGPNDAFYYIGGLTGEFLLDSPFPANGGGLSHVSYFNGTTTRVPEAGALILFGSGLVGLVGYRRMRRMQ